VRSVLVAPLGDHPAIITAAVDALQRAGVAVGEVEILCPDDPVIRLGAEWIGLELDCEIRIHILPFADANSELAARQYLQALAAVLQGCEVRGALAHLLLAAGRKNMSALTGTVAQFFACVNKLYHLLDVHENDPLRRNLFSVEDLNQMSDSTRQQRMHPPADSINLFEVPFPRIRESTAIRDFLHDPLCKPIPPYPLDADAREFFEDVFRSDDLEPVFKVLLTRTAFSEFEKVWRTDRNRAERFRKSFRQMRQPGRLKSRLGMHGIFGVKGATFHFYKRAGTAERPFYYTRPNPIALYPKKQVKEVVVCGLSVEQGNGGYSPTAEQLLEQADREPLHPLSDLPTGAERQPAALLAPVGDTPMVASQAYVLLQQVFDIASVNLLYPGKNPEITRSARGLADDFGAEKVKCELISASNLTDVDSTAACHSYLKALADALTGLARNYPDHEVQLLLSGGRKTMAALNMFAAQYAGLPRVWHTLVRDARLEKRMEQELQGASPTRRRDILFLRRYATDNFELFAVPVLQRNGEEPYT
jgi:hypothetical protein